MSELFEKLDISNLVILQCHSMGCLSMWLNYLKIPNVIVHCDQYSTIISLSWFVSELPEIDVLNEGVHVRGSIL